MISRFLPPVRILSLEMCDELIETDTLLALVTCLVEDRIVSVLVSRQDSGRLLVALVASPAEQELTSEARQIVARRVERLVRWMIREDAGRG